MLCPHLSSCSQCSDGSTGHSGLGQGHGKHPDTCQLVLVDERKSQISEALTLLFACSSHPGGLVPLGPPLFPTEPAWRGMGQGGVPSVGTGLALI